MNLIFGRYQFGRYIFASKTGSKKSKEIIFKPGLAQIIAYDKNGVKTAIFGNNIENSAFSSFNFEIADTGSGPCTITFKKLPSNTELEYHQRIDIHLFGDYRPWYSGYIATIPEEGGTAEEFKVTARGYYNKLEDVTIFAEYEDTEVADIVKNIMQTVEFKTGIKYNASKVTKVGYNISYIKFDGVTAKEAIKQLSEFAQDYVFGVDEYQDAFFKPRNDNINEEARIWVGIHVDAFEPVVNVEKIVNKARIKGAKSADDGDVWIADVEDIESQQKFGIKEKVWTLPTAYSEDDAERWGQSEINRYKDPVKSAKVKGLILEYPKTNKFWVRKLSTDGKALIYNTKGKSYAYPITKLKYTIDADKGIVCDLELGEQPYQFAKYLYDIERNARNTDLLEQANRSTNKG